MKGLEITTEKGSMRGNKLRALLWVSQPPGTETPSLKKHTGSIAHTKCISSITTNSVAVEESGVKDAWESHLPSHLHGADCW